MPDICICHQHTQGIQQIEQIIRTHEFPVADRYGLKTRWELHTLHVERSGMKARIEVEERQVQVKIHVPWILRSWIPEIEAKVRRGLARYFC